MDSVSVRYLRGRWPQTCVSRYLLFTAFFGAPVLEHCQASLARVWYVSARAVGTNTGDCWGDAFRDLQDALAVARFGDEIWVAAGRYTPDRGTKDRAASFVLVDGVALYGGFSGDETARDQRDWTVNESVLSGDLNGDDGPIDCSPFSNCCAWRPGEFGCDDPVCEATVCASNSYCCLGPNGWDTSCTIVARMECCELGGWDACENSLTVVDATEVGPSTILDGLTISGSHLLRDVAVGAGLRLDGSALTVRNTTLARNSPYGARANGASGPVFEDCVILDNVAAGISLNDAGGPTFRGCSFVRNVPGLELSRDHATIARCTFHANRGYGLAVGGDVDVSGCDFVENRTWAISHVGGRLTANNCAFIENGGGAISNWSSLTVVSNSRFLGQRHTVVTSTTANNNFVNCVFAGNDVGSAVFYQGDGRLSLTNCTIAHNRTSGSHAAIWVTDTRVAVTDSIVWGNRNSDSPDLESMQIWTYNTLLDIKYSIVEGWSGVFGGVGNSGADPLFVDVDGADDIIGTEDDNLRLSPDSPAINAGDPDAASYLTGSDLDGHARILCGRVDIGAYEFGIGDIDCNRTVNLSDFSAWSFCVAHPDAGSNGFGCNSFDFNADGSIDLRDFAAFQRAFGP